MVFSTGMQPQITKIYNVIMFDSEEIAKGKSFIEFNGNLNCYELVYYLGGENVTTFNHKKMRNTNGSIQYLPKGIVGAKYTVDIQKHGCGVDIFFDTVLPLPQESFSQQLIDARLRYLFEQAEQIWRQKRIGYYARSMSFFYEIIAISQDADSCSHISNRQFERIAPSVLYIEQNCFKPDFSYRMLAEVSGLSYSYFKSIFMKKFDATPSRYITNLKITYATELLITGRYTITQIADMTGFENVYYFSTFFKKETGTSPKHYINH